MAIAEAVPEAPHWPRSAYLNAIDPEATPRRIALVAFGPQPDCVLGFVVACILPQQAELETMAVTTESQRQGLGQLLFHALAAELKTASAHELFLEVRASNRQALAFYFALGFVETGARPSYYTDPIEDAILMCLSIR